MKRSWPFNICSVLSLVLLVVTMSLGVRSYHRMDEVSLITKHHAWRVKSIGGTLQFGTASPLMYPRGIHWAVSPLQDLTGDWTWLYPAARTQRGVLGFASVKGEYDLGRATVFYRVTVVPVWPFALLLAVCPTIRLVRWLSPKRRKIGYCPKCGYDLRSSKDRCPECGTQITLATE